MGHTALLSIGLTLNRIVLGRTVFDVSKKFEIPILSLKKSEVCCNFFLIDTTAVMQ